MQRTFREAFGLFLSKLIALTKLAAAAAALFYLLLCLAVWFWQDRLLFFPVRGYPLKPNHVRMDFEAETLRTSDGVRLAAWWIPAAAVAGGEGSGASGRQSGARGTVLFCHGNGGNMSDLLDFARVYRDAGWNTLLFDYRGYGDSEGRPTE